MRLAFAISGVALILGVTISFSQQAPGTSSHKGSIAKARSGKARPEYRPAYAGNKVEVINGATAHTVVFDQGHPASSPDEKAPPQSMARGRAEAATVVPSQFRVDVVNGISSETQYFYWNPEQQQGLAFNAQIERPVVIGIESSNTRIMGGNKHPLVIGIEQSGTSEPGAQRSPPKLEYRLVPQPKRLPYRPAESQ